LNIVQLVKNNRTIAFDIKVGAKGLGKLRYDRALAMGKKAQNYLSWEPLFAKLILWA
jgi:hypothetical protein